MSIRYRYDILKILRYRYRYFQNDKHVHIIQAQEQDVNV